ncbi:ribonuclease H-like domain-containing protein [Tanacetum coccineum]
MVRSMWLFKHKFHANGTLSRNKAWLVANGSSQQQGINLDETFSPVVKLATIRIVSSLAVSRKWPIHQLDVKTAFLNSSSSALLQQIIDSLHKEFDVTDLGTLNYFLGIFADRTSTSLFLSQRKYALQLLERAHMDPTLYRSLAGGLQYLTFTRPDFSYAVQQGTVDFGLQLYLSTTTSLVGYTDADWAGFPSTRRSTSGYCVFFGDNLLSWSSKHQHTLSRSSGKAKYHGVANVFAETAWLRNVLRKLHSPLSTATIVYCDNVSAVYLSANPVQHQRTKHIEIDIHFVRDVVTAGQVRVLHVPSRYQFAYIFTKGLPSALFEDFRSSLSVRPSFARTAGAY